jgi:hypothetical protein
MAYQCFRNDAGKLRCHGDGLHKPRAITMLQLRRTRLWNWLLRRVAALRAWAERPARAKPLRINRFH